MARERVQDLGFDCEADMLGLVAKHARSIGGPNAITRFEVASAAGVPDLVFAILNHDVLASREITGFLIDPTHLAVVSKLSQALSTSRSMTADQISFFVGVSSKHLKTKVLPHLLDTGFIVRDELSRWAAAFPFESPILRLVTVETKVRDWRKGLGQAARHAAGADEAWLVLDSRFAYPATLAEKAFSSNAVGLASLSEIGVWKTLFQPGHRASLGLRRELLAERVARMVVAGEVAGPLPCVFGRRLTATRSDDPRLASALAH